MVILRRQTKSKYSILHRFSTNKEKSSLAFHSGHLSTILLHVIFSVRVDCVSYFFSVQLKRKGMLYYKQWVRM